VSDVVMLAHVSLRRGGQTILHEVDWTVRDGERWVVLGPNGAGKTTLLEVASLYLYPSSGRVTVLGAVHGHEDIRPLRGRIGYASAPLARLLHPDTTVLQAVATGRTGVLDPFWAVPGDEDVEAARDLLARLGCAGLVDHELGTLSEGERQRVQIARALMAAPDLLVLDEPSAGLDLGARELLVASLAGLAADRRMRAILFVTHHVEEIPAGFTHVLLLRGGRVVASGPIAEALTSEALTACFGLPLTVDVRAGRWTARASDEGGAVQGDGDGDGDRNRGRRSLVRAPDGRMKAFRPLPGPARLEALARGLEAYAGGDFFEAHEILEPAWMGTDDLAERDLYQGLIKLAAAGVHAVRGNPEGVRRNLLGAAGRLERVPATADGVLGEALAAVDLGATTSWLAAALVALEAAPPQDAQAGGAAGRLLGVTRLLAASPAPVRSGAGSATRSRALARQRGPGRRAAPPS
jgi:iron complex transport system ATP-binding protein